MYIRQGRIPHSRFEARLHRFALVWIFMGTMVISVYDNTEARLAGLGRELLGLRSSFAVVVIVLVAIFSVLSIFLLFVVIEARRLAAEMSKPPDPSRPTVWLTSNGLSNDRLRAEFVRLPRNLMRHWIS